MSDNLWGVYRLEGKGWVLHDGPLFRLDAYKLREYRREQYPNEDFAAMEFNEPGLTQVPQPYEWYIDHDETHTRIGEVRIDTRVRYYKVEYGLATQRWAVRVTDDNGKTWATWMTLYKREGNARKRAQQMIDNGYGAWWGEDKREPEKQPQAEQVTLGARVDFPEEVVNRLEFYKWAVEQGIVNEFAVVGTEGGE